MDKIIIIYFIKRYFLFCYLSPGLSRLIRFILSGITVCITVLLYKYHYGFSRKLIINLQQGDVSNFTQFILWKSVKEESCPPSEETEEWMEIWAYLKASVKNKLMHNKLNILELIRLRLNRITCH